MGFDGGARIIGISRNGWSGGAWNWDNQGHSSTHAQAMLKPCSFPPVPPHPFLMFKKFCDVIPLCGLNCFTSLVTWRRAEAILRRPFGVLHARAPALAPG